MGSGGNSMIAKALPLAAGAGLTAMGMPEAGIPMMASAGSQMITTPGEPGGQTPPSPPPPPRPSAGGIMAPGMSPPPTPQMMPSQGMGLPPGGMGNPQMTPQMMAMIRQQMGIG